VFLDALVRGAFDRDRRVAVVVALRADFYGRWSEHPRFGELLSANHVLVGSMDRGDLVRAIELPADRAGLEVERPLVEALVSDVAEEPGGLPLLSTALLELWRDRDGRLLRYESYRGSGGVRGAVARLAEQAYARLDESEQAAARTIMLRLCFGEGPSVVRRRVPLAELDVDRDARVAHVPVILTDARLLTVSDGTVEVAHEALLRGWPRLRGWLEEDREGRRLHTHLAAAAREWAERDRDPAELYRECVAKRASGCAARDDSFALAPVSAVLAARLQHPPLCKHLNHHSVAAERTPRLAPKRDRRADRRAPPDNRPHGGLEIGELRVPRGRPLTGPAFVSAQVFVRGVPNCPADAARSRARHRRCT
jgi:hypothetical protein